MQLYFLRAGGLAKVQAARRLEKMSEEKNKTSEGKLENPRSNVGVTLLRMGACGYVRQGITLRMLIRSVTPGLSKIVTVPLTWTCVIS